MWAGFTSRGLTGLHLALQGEKVLRRAQIDLEEENPEGWSALHCAANGGYLKAVENLLACGADVNKPTGGPRQMRRTPLMTAAWGGHEDIGMYCLPSTVCPQLFALS